MPHDIFISYASENEAIAGDAQQVLEANGYECWLAPREITAGERWPKALVEAVADARAVVVLLSRAAIESRHVQRELQIADDRRVPVAPLRLERIDVTKLPYSLAGLQHIDYEPTALVQAVDALLGTRRRVPINVPEDKPAEESNGSEEPGYAVRAVYLLSGASYLHFVRDCPSVVRAQFKRVDVAPNGDLLDLVLEFDRKPCPKCLRKLRERQAASGTLIFATEDFEAHTERVIDFVDDIEIPLGAIEKIAPLPLPKINGWTLKVEFDQGDFGIVFDNAGQRDAAWDILDGLRR